MMKVVLVSLATFTLCVSPSYCQDACMSQPCQNNGECKPMEDTFECRCPKGITGNLCDIDIDECASNPCRNGGRCTQTTVNNYTCNCPLSFTGQNCDTYIDHCMPNPCQYSKCINLEKGYRCDCIFDFVHFNETHCLPTNNCSTNICRNGKCIQDTKSYKPSCQCFGGFFGEFCDKEKCSSNPCQNGGTCQNFKNNYTCHCAVGYSGPLCETVIDHCASKPCIHGQCFNSHDRYDCKCDTNYTGDNCERNVCDPNPCNNSARCIPYENSYRQYMCICSPEYYGVNCEKPQRNYCDYKPCGDRGNCTGNLTSYECHCNKGFQGKQCEEKRNYCHPNPCNNGTCANLSNGRGYKCMCFEGFTGSTCQQDVNECSALNPCSNNAVCINDIGGFHCQCPQGFSGTLCDQRDIHCFENTCINNGSCFDQFNGYTCKCPKFYTGSNCHYKIEPCDKKPCMNGGTCFYTGDGFKCKCPPGFTGPRCECKTTDQLCRPNNCDIIGTQIYQPVVDGYKCICTSHWSGQYCNTSVDCDTITCHNGGTCEDSQYGAACICPVGYFGEHCENQMSKCYPNPCLNQGTCTEKNNNYMCSCPDWATGENCKTQVYLSCDTSPCLNGGSCVLRDGSYVCDCPKYWTGYKCQDPLRLVSQICLDNKCMEKGNNGVCDQECNYEECLYDNTECSFGMIPWQNCTQRTAKGKSCSQAFDDGICNQECYTANCLFDGYDCDPPAEECRYKNYCETYYSNSQCDSGCNNAACGWDGLDCEQDQQDVFEGSIFIIIAKRPEDFEKMKTEFLYMISHLVQAAVRIRKHSKDEMANVINSSSLTMRDGMTVGVFLEVQKSGCYKQSQAKCFISSENVAQFIAEAMRTRSPDPKFDVLHVGAVKVLPPATEETDKKYLLMMAIFMVFVTSLIFIIMGMVLLRQKRARGITWFPENFKQNLADVSSSKLIGKDSQNTTLEMKRMYVDHTTPPPSNQGSMEDVDDDDSPKAKKMKVNRVESVDFDQVWKQEHLYVTSTALTPLHGLDIIPFDVNLKGPDGYTPLMLAAIRGSGLGEEDENNLGSMSSDVTDNDNSTTTDVMTHLISQGAAINAQTDRTHETALHLAARYSRADAAKLLLDAGADPNATDCNGRTPLHSAVAADATGVFQLLLRNRSTNLNARMHCGTTALMLACRLSIEDTVEELIAADIDLEASDNNGKTALHWAASVNNVSALMTLLKHQANRDAQTAKEETPLFLASREGALESVRTLLDCYANRDLSDHMDRLPKDIALERRHLEIVDLLDNYKVAPPPTADLYNNVVSHKQPGFVQGQQIRQTKSKSRKKLPVGSDAVYQNSSIGKNSKAKKTKVEAETKEKLQHQRTTQLLGKASQSGQQEFVPSPKVNIISSRNGYPLLTTANLSTGQQVLPLDFTNWKLYNHNLQPLQITVGHEQVKGNAISHVVDSVTSVATTPVITVQKQMSGREILPFPPDVILQQTNCQQAPIQQMSLPASHFNKSPIQLVQTVAESPHHLAFTSYQLEHLLTPSPDSCGHWSSPRSTNSEMSDNTTSPYELLSQVYSANFAPETLYY
ncbi:neurogenic locus Notch protein [Biomphalaria glabrata]|nr:neurogenic locus Notch protein-like; partial [Biomphalaria glabrata]